MLWIRPNDLTAHQGWFFLLRVDQQQMTLEVQRGDSHGCFPVWGTCIAGSYTHHVTRIYPSDNEHPAYRIECTNCLIEAVGG